jgi:hypothetical protein
MNYGTPRLETPWATPTTLQTVVPINNHIIEQPPPMPVITIPRREEITTTDNSIRNIYTYLLSQMYPFSMWRSEHFML